MSETGEIQAQVPNYLESVKVLPAKEGIKKAQKLFQSEGFTVGENGTLQPPFAQNGINKLKEIVDSGTDRSTGNLMPTKDDFY